MRVEYQARPRRIAAFAAALSPLTAVGQRTPQPVFAYDPAAPSQLLGSWLISGQLDGKLQPLRVCVASRTGSARRSVACPGLNVGGNLIEGAGPATDRGEPAALSTGDDARRGGHRSGRNVRRRGGRNRHRVVTGKDKNGHGYVRPMSRGVTRRPSGPAWRSPPTRRTGPTVWVAEVNNGGDMVGATLRMVDPNVAFSAVRAARGKVVRANRWRRSISRVASITSAPSRNSKTR
jgi:hypothetical protein